MTAILSAASGLAANRSALFPALFAMALGLGVLFVAGFADATELHNAAHDGRHAFAFPCH